MKNFESFTNLYPLSKTLRFELRPIGRTLENIQANGLLEQDNHRAESYKLVKAIIDRYHKVFIDEALSHCVLPVENSGNKNSLSEVYQYLTTKDHSEKETDDFNKTQDNLRKMIVSALKKDTHFGRIFKKELIREDLLNNDLQGFDLNEEEYDLIKEFRDFTTYFVGFNENRANMYSEEAKSTAIGYRLIHENLPKFIDNMKTFAEYVPTIAMPHMGAEYQPSHDELRQNLYRRMIDYAGVESVIADHPHWVQDAEAYNNKLIVYSMGNFMFDQYSGGEYSRSAAIEANADINVKDVDFDKWDDLGKACLKDKISCLEKIQNAKLTRLSVDWKYDYHATTSAGDCITRMADANEQNAVGQRLRWSTIPASLKVEK